MANSQRMQAALDRLESHRVEIEASIVEELERKFFSVEEAAPESTIDHWPSDNPGPLCEDDILTYTGSPFTFSWYGIG